MGQINLNDLQKRKLQECYLAWYVINKEVTIRNSTCIEKKMLYLIYGVDIIGNRQIIGTYFENEKDNRFWLETFEDLKARNAQTVLFLVTPEHRNIERCAKIVYNSIKVVHAPDDVIMSITKFFSEKPSRRLTVCFKNLFLAEDLNKYKDELQLFKDQFIENKVVLMLLERKEKKIEEFYKYSLEIRKFLYPYYPVREMRKFLNKLNTLETLCTNITEITEFCLPYINKFENGRSYYKKEWLELISTLYDNYPGIMEVYLNG